MFSSKDVAMSPSGDVADGHAGSPIGLGCMVIGTSNDRRQLLLGAAQTAGWSVAECSDAKTARITLLRAPQEMVVIDLEDAGGTAPGALKTLAERISKQKKSLLVLCGNEGNAIEEIWARQLGVWLYLPGVVDDSDLASLFEEAGSIAARRQSTVQRHMYFPGQNAATA